MSSLFPVFPKECLLQLVLRETKLFLQKTCNIYMNSNIFPVYCELYTIPERTLGAQYCAWELR
jgi:hypothetical protein